MEERMSWGEAIGAAWGNLTGSSSEGGSVRTIRLLFFLLFIGGTAWAGYNFVKAQTLLEEKVYYPETTANTVQADEKRLNAMVAEVQSTSQMRTNSATMVDSMEDGGRYAFADPTMFPSEGPRPPVADVVTLVPPPVVVEMPPEIVVRAIMTMGKQRVAVMDIVGIGNGLMVRAGDTFMQKKGRVVQIAPDKVVLRWADHNFDIRPNF
ncbi:MAG: hypothetical protein LBR61_03660 [Synergistaceae bacterium]|jgi:hypothetical protein|nr:hypothetical protein [Synergistaceae bacterium]